MYVDAAGKKHETKEARNIASVEFIFTFIGEHSLEESRASGDNTEWKAAASVDWEATKHLFLDRSRVVEVPDSPFKTCEGVYALRDYMTAFMNSPFGKLEVDVKSITALENTLVITNTFHYEKPLEDAEVFIFDDAGKIIDIYMHWGDLEVLKEICAGES